MVAVGEESPNYRYINAPCAKVIPPAMQRLDTARLRARVEDNVLQRKVISENTCKT